MNDSLIIGSVEFGCVTEADFVYCNSVTVRGDFIKVGFDKVPICSKVDFDAVVTDQGEIKNGLLASDFEIIKGILEALSKEKEGEESKFPIAKIGNADCKYKVASKFRAVQGRIVADIEFTASCGLKVQIDDYEKDFIVSLIISASSEREEVSANIVSTSKFKFLNFDLGKIQAIPIDNFVDKLNEGFEQAIRQNVLLFKQFSSFSKGIAGVNLSRQEGRNAFIEVDKDKKLSLGFVINANPTANISKLEINLLFTNTINFDVDIELAASFPYEFNEPIRVPGPFNVKIGEGTVTPNLTLRIGEDGYEPPTGETKISIDRAVVSLKDDPSAYIALSAKWTVDTDLKSKVTNVKILNIAGQISDINLPVIEFPELPKEDFNKLIKFLKGVINWVGNQAAELGSFLLGLGESVLKTLIEWIESLDDKCSIRIILEKDSLEIAQIHVEPKEELQLPGITIPGFSLLCGTVKGILVLNFRGTPWQAIGLKAEGANEKIFSLATDLWIGATEGAQKYASDSTNPLISFSVKSTSMLGNYVCPIVLDDGKARFFQQLEAGDGREYRLESLQWGKDFKYDYKVNNGKLPILSNGINGQQGLEIEVSEGSGNENEIQILVSGSIGIGDYTANTQLSINIELDTLTASIEGDRVKVIGNKEEDGETILGMNASWVVKKYVQGSTDTFVQFYLDFSDGDPRLALASDDATLKLSYDRISSAGKGFVFDVDEFAITRSGVDLSAKVNKSPVRLAGVDLPFEFNEGSLLIRRSKIQSFSMAASGNLPPDLVGDAKASVILEMGTGANNGLVVKAATGKLEGTGEPLFCEGTQIKTKVSSLGFRFVEDNGYHFYFTISGSATFSPRDDSLTGGLMKSLEGFSITLNECPLTTDMSVLAKHIEFQIPLNPPLKTNVFNIFELEVRGVGFHPSSDEFGGDPAFCISGQIKFVEIGDVMKPKIDFHKLWIAPPAGDDILPRFKCGDLSLDLQLGSTARVSGRATTVDKTLAGLTPNNLPKEIMPKGFIAEGRLEIEGWAPMSANMAFLELENEETREKRHAFFFYIQQTHLSHAIPTPIGSIYLREVGFGFGYRYTLAGLAKADEVSNPRDLIKLLDEVSKYQGDLYKFKAWSPEVTGSRLTLAVRGMFTVATASSGKNYNEKKEKDLPNPILFDITAALRSDLTFLLTARAWLCYNYADWLDESNPEWKENSGLRGYMYISAPKKEFLGRFVANKNMPIGEHPKLPSQLVKAIKSSKASSTLYIRPGLFHFEMGWPYELEYELDYGKKFKATCSGGLVHRVNNEGYLSGVAFRCKGRAEFGGEVGGRKLGASAYGVANFGLEAKMISFIAFKRVSDSLFYAALSLDVAIRFKVRVWLEFKVLGKEVKLKAGFSLNLAISAAIELAVTPNSIGGRANVSIRVRALGKSLSVRVSLKFNESYVLEARKRVQRFMSLGLGVDSPELSEGLAAKEADRIVEQEAESDSELGEATHDEVADSPGVFEGVGVEIEANPKFWAVIFPIKDSEYILTLIPKKGFYGSPELYEDKNKHYYKLELEEIESSIEYWENSKWKSLEEDIEIRPNNSIVSEDLELKDLIKECYVVGYKDGETFKTFPEGEQLDEKIVYRDIPERKEAELSKNLVHSEQSAAGSLEKLHVIEQWYEAIEERRSMVIAAVANSAKLLAKDPTRGIISSDGDVDCRSLGLTFKVSGIDSMFGISGDQNAKPPIAEFTLKEFYEKDKKLKYRKATVELLNPIDRHFVIASPRLAKQSIEIFSGGIGINFDLEPEWATSSVGNITGYDDPEYLLRHYKVERQIFNLDDSEPVNRFTIKPADSVEYRKVGEVIQKVFVRPKYQIVDNFDDVDPRVKERILASAKDAKFKTAPLYHDKRIEITYVITPVDIAGTEGLSTPMEIVAEKVFVGKAPVKDAILNIEYTTNNNELKVNNYSIMLVDEGIGFDENSKKLTGLDYVICFRDEGIRSRGQYGSDALTESKSRLSKNVTGELAGRKVELKKDNFDLKNTDFQNIDKESGSVLLPLKADSIKDWKLDRETSVIAWIRPKGEQKDMVWTPLKFRSWHAPVEKPQVDEEKAEKENLFEVVLDRYERIQRKDFPFIKPLSVGGRLHNLYPNTNASLEDLLDNKTSFELLRDGERRVGIKIDFNASPKWNLSEGNVELKDRNKVNPKFIAGFDILSVDRDSLPAGRDVKGEFKKVARVNLAEADEAAEHPSKLEKFDEIDAYYPSETFRLKNAQNGERRAGWYSNAESLLKWPSFNEGVRKYVMPEVDELFIQDIFEVGKPLGVTFEIRCIYVEDSGSNKENDVKVDILENIDRCILISSVEQLRVALQFLTYKNGLEVRGITNKYKAKEPTYFLTATAYICEKKTSLAKVEISFEADLHPILQDTVDLLKYGDDGSDKAFNYRRYEVLLEEKSVSVAKDLESLINETPENLDPYGWSILRSLNLAVGLRVYDMQYERYCTPQELLQRVNETFNKVLTTYGVLRRDINSGEYGDPFVDIITRPGGLSTISSFDGGDPKIGNKVNDLYDQSTSIVQLSLRPTVGRELIERKQKEEGVTKQIYLSKRIDYYKVSLSQSRGVSYEVDISDSKVDVLIDILPIDSGYIDNQVYRIGRGSHVVAGYNNEKVVVPSGKMLIRVIYDDSSIEDFRKYINIKKVEISTGVGGEKIVSTETKKPFLETSEYCVYVYDNESISIDLSQKLIKKIEDLCGRDDITTFIEIGSIARVYRGNDLKTGGLLSEGKLTLPNVNPEDIAGSRLKGFVNRIQVKIVSTDLALINNPRIELPDESNRFFGCSPYEKFTSLSYDMLKFVLSDYKDSNFNINEHIANYSISEALSYSLKQEERLDFEMFVKAQAWSYRFMKHMAVKRVGISFSLSSITKFEPLYLVPDERNHVSLTLPEKTRYGIRRSFAVLPYGRYENFTNLVDPFDPSEILVHRITSALKYEQSNGKEKKQVIPVADVSIPRTARIAKPAILAARQRTELDKVSSVLRPAKEMEIILPHHEEAVLASSNRAVEAAVGHEGTVLQLERRSSAKVWQQKMLALLWGESLEDAAVNKRTLKIVNSPFGSGHKRFLAILEIGIESDGKTWTISATGHSFVIGDTVIISSESSEYDGRFIVENVIDSNSFTISNRNKFPTSKGKVKLAMEVGDRKPEEEALDLVAREFPDLWRGADYFSILHMPYFFEIAAITYQRAGVVVSEPNASVIPEGYYSFSHQEGRVKAKPENGRWDIKYIDEKPRLMMQFDLVKYKDLMDPVAREMWCAGEAKDLFDLPDPDIYYELTIDSEFGEVSEKELLIFTDKNGRSEEEGFEVKVDCIGSRFPEGAVEAKITKVEKSAALIVEIPVNEADRYEYQVKNIPVSYEDLFNINDVEPMLYVYAYYFSKGTIKELLEQLNLIKGSSYFSESDIEFTNEIKEMIVNFGQKINISDFNEASVQRLLDLGLKRMDAVDDELSLINVNLSKIEEINLILSPLLGEDIPIRNNYEGLNHFIPVEAYKKLDYFTSFNLDFTAVRFNRWPSADDLKDYDEAVRRFITCAMSEGVVPEGSKDKNPPVFGAGRGPVVRAYRGIAKPSEKVRLNYKP